MIYLAYCHACDRGWASKLQAEVERHARDHVVDGLSKSIAVRHVVDVVEVEIENKMPQEGRKGR